MTTPAEDGSGDPGSRFEELTAPEAVREHYRSVDSAPEEYALERSPRAVIGFLVAFVALSLLALLVVAALIGTGRLDDGDIVFFSASGSKATIPVRVFILVYFVVFSLTLVTNLWRRLVVLLELAGSIVLISLAVDLVTLAAYRIPGVSPPVTVQQIVASIVGVSVFPLVVLGNARLPDPVPAPARTARIGVVAWSRLLVPLLLAVALAGLVARQFDGATSAMRAVALLGGIGPGVFLVQQALAVFAAAIGVVVVVRGRRTRFAPPVGVLVPAHNEAHGIAATIRALDLAAGSYDAPVHLYVVDNASGDDTAAVAGRAMARTRHLSCTMLSCAQPGKATALNYGLERLTEPFVLRVDADSVVGERCLSQVMRHFSDPRVGAVGGLPLPPRTKTYVGRVRLVEVLLRHAFYQVARMGYAGIVGVPGMLTAYRRSAVDEAGPLMQGMNGEDTDICMRMNSLGYRSVVDPRAVYASEVPATWAHLTEQRIRWFRSTYHVAAHNRRALLRPGSMAGAVVLPLALFNTARRAMLIPLLLFAALTLGIFRADFIGVGWEPLLAMVIGLPALVAVGVCLLLGRPRALLYVPEYLTFRVVRSYLTLSSLFTLRFPPMESPWKWYRARGRPAPDEPDSRPGRTSR